MGSEYLVKLHNSLCLKLTKASRLLGEYTRLIILGAETTSFTEEYPPLPV